VNPDWVWREQFRSWGAAGEARFADFAAYALENESTLHFGHTADEVRSLYFELVAKADANPIVYQESVIDGPMFRLFSLSFIYHDSTFESLADLWQHVRDGVGDGTTPTTPESVSAPGFPDVPQDNREMSAGAVLCDDVAWSHSVDRYERELQFDEQRFPMFAQLGSNIWACAFWRASPVEPPVELTSNGPANHILLLNTLRDPATPLPGATRVHELLGKRSRLILVEGGGHAIYGFMDNSCATETVTAYLADGTFPPKDATCPANLANAETQPVRTSRTDVSGRADTPREKAIREIARRLMPIHR